MRLHFLNTNFSTFPVLGLDLITTGSIFGYESSSSQSIGGGKEKVVLPDTSHFLRPSFEVFWRLRMRFGLYM